MSNTIGNPTLGLQIFGRSEGASPTAGMTPVWIASTDASFIFRGDVVVTSTTAAGSNNSGAYITSVTAVSASSGFLARGVFQGCFQFQQSAGRVVWSNSYQGAVTGSTGDIKAYVIDDPDALFLVQASTKGAVTSSMIGLNISISTGSSTGNQTTGYSNVQVESTSIGSTSTLPLRLVDFYSAYAPGFMGGGIAPVSAGASQTNFINGTDNANAANMVIVRLNNCDRLNLTSKST